jgi:hypothetical protein
MRYFIGTLEDIIKNHKTYEELSRALNATRSKPSYDDVIVYVFDDQNNLLELKHPGDELFLKVKVWFYQELHNLENTYGRKGWPENQHISFPRLERELKDRMLK